MAVQVFRNLAPPQDLLRAVLPILIIGLALLARTRETDGCRTTRKMKSSAVLLFHFCGAVIGCNATSKSLL
jgi:hypothetical protein